MAHFFFNMTRQFIVCLMLSFGSCFAQQGTALLTMGDTAPGIQVQEWLNGEKITKFEPGHVYLLEFGSVSCGPCRVAMPHLNHLAERFAGRATIISIYVYENGAKPADTLSTAYVGRVEKFIRTVSAKMKINYHVAVDKPAQPMVSSYLTASQNEGIPVSFIVDGNGRVVWKGQPVYADDIIELVLSGKTPAENDRTLKEIKFKQVYGNTTSGNVRNRMAVMDSLMLSNPELHYLHTAKFSLLLKTDESGAYQYARGLLDSVLRDDEVTFLAIASEINFK